jgi:hypothetical protein
MSRAIPSSSGVFQNADPALRPLVETLNAQFKERPLDMPSLKRALVSLLEFLSNPAGRTDANCRAADGFFFHDESWVDAKLPEPYHDVIAHMDALHDTISAPHIAQNFESTPEQLLARARAL